jgi:aspartate carbamoyltransferase catalytic subunit
MKVFYLLLSMIKGKDIVSIKDLKKEEIEEIFKVADTMVPYAEGNSLDILKGKILATLFFEPSTRTKMSFEASMHKLGGNVITFSDPKTTSFAKGETLADTIRMVDSYSDVIVIRHSYEGAAKLAAYFAEHPVINAGDGAGQHPTQTLLDLYTIKKEKRRLNDLNIGFVGDLKYGRTVHSLTHALAEFGANLYFISPKLLQMPDFIIREVSDSVKQVITDNLEEVIKDLDVIYVTRIQKERFGDINEYQKVVGSYIIDKQLLENAKEDVIIMHPLPRINEISTDVDDLPNAKYFKQAANGIPIRMALLSMVLGAR